MLPFTCAGSVAVCISDNELPPWIWYSVTSPLTKHVYPNFMRVVESAMSSGQKK